MSKSILSELYINDLLGCAMSRDFSDRNSVDALKMILSHLDDLSITRAMVEQFVDKLGDISGENVQGDVTLKNTRRFDHKIVQA